MTAQLPSGEEVRVVDHKERVGGRCHAGAENERLWGHTRLGCELHGSE